MATITARPHLYNGLTSRHAESRRISCANCCVAPAELPNNRPVGVSLSRRSSSFSAIRSTISTFKKPSRNLRHSERQRGLSSRVFAQSASAAEDLADKVRDDLKGCSLYVVGDDSAANKALANKLAQLLRYAPMETETIIEQVTKMPISDLIAQEGSTALGGAEFVVLQELSANLRCCVATAGGGVGAAARGDCWPALFGAITIWLDEVAEEPPAESAPQRDCYRQAEIQLKVPLAGQRSEEGWVDEAAKATVEGVQQMLDAWQGDGSLPGKKSLYIRLGCRGDWPDLKPPQWDPNRPDENTEVGPPPTK
mmetsp:Transcript_15605/g.26291  ORF Transcript_15605/g.26291 Transcript_15605/m.26291 type:complete len:310 (+) Transcript_15605:69-998(+)|eukprot:CAMPEP_0198215594 /NCGR_PEP_ID=MMETSP1445-20131203/51163_1 /TAXON_ID=36898 /ORGANISM="Pyramimonas sp., Strain CCMP2087" /LENGTH=309 /DNA_ID=CAMNT_0043891405 /DNA_START=62 /DNA_END=991 /DNA_ORIENTATION=-